MEYSHKLITAPTIEPLVVDEVRLHTRIDHTVEDSLLASWIKAGRQHAEDYQRRAYIQQVWEIGFDGFPETPILLPRPPLMQVLHIKYIDYQGNETYLYYTHEQDETTTTTPDPDTSIGEDDFIIDTDSEPGRISLAYEGTWPVSTLQPINSVKIKYIAGYGDLGKYVPDTVKDAIHLYCAWRYENRVGEGGELPSHFYDILRPGRLYYP